MFQLAQRNESIISCSAPHPQMKACCKHRGRPSTLSSRLARRVTQLKQKAAAQRGAPSAGTLHGRGDPGAAETTKSKSRQGGKGVWTEEDFKAQAPLLFISTAKLISTTAVDPSEPRQDWEAGQTVKKKRGRKPKALMSVDQNRTGRASEKQEFREEKSDSESSEHGEFAAKQGSCR